MQLLLASSHPYQSYSGAAQLLKHLLNSLLQYIWSSSAIETLIKLLAPISFLQAEFFMNQAHTYLMLLTITQLGQSENQWRYHVTRAQGHVMSRQYISLYVMTIINTCGERFHVLRVCNTCTARVTSHHVSLHVSNHVSRHVTCHITCHYMCQITCHVTTRVTCHITCHVSLHVSRHITCHIMCHITCHVTFC